jgi:ferritin-like metal-binding protein YciE
LGEEDVADWLEPTFNQEEETDHKLTELAESGIHAQAAEGDEEDELAMNESRY